MKRLYTFILVLSLSLNFAEATEWFVVDYKLSCFQVNANQLLGSECVVPDLFPQAVRLNNYVKNKIETGQLKNKPVIYDLYAYNFNRERYTLEVFETDNAYHISINWRESYTIHFSTEELAKIVDYFAHPNFEPFYCNLYVKSIFFNKIDTLVGTHQRFGKDHHITYTVYEADSLKIEYAENRFYVSWQGQDTGITLDYPISIPIRFNERVIFVTYKYFFVFENGKLIKKINVEGEDNLIYASGHQIESNQLNILLGSDWLNIGDNEDYWLYSYCYSKNRFYKLNIEE